MLPMEATIIDRKRRLRESLWWIVALLPLFFVTLPLAILHSYQQWSIPGALSAAFLLPFSVVALPFIVTIGGLANTGGIVFSFLWVAANSVLLFNAWSFAKEGHQVLRLCPPTMTSVRDVIGRARRFYVWVWSVWAEYLAYFLLVVLSPLYVLLGPLRQLVFTISLKNNVWAKDHPSFYGYLMFVFYLQVAIGIPAAAYLYLGTDRLFEGIVVAIAIVTFIALQFQKMTPPYFVPTFVDPDNQFCSDGPFKSRVDPAVPIGLAIRITNLGISAFKDCTFRVTFPRGFSVLDGFDLYQGNPYAKHFTVRESCTVAEFCPRDSDMTFAPCTSLVFPIYILSPEENAEYQIVASLSSESAWGVHNQPLSIIVSGEHVPPAVD